jgi:hypothetical protein
MFKSKKMLLLCITAATLGAGIMLFNSPAKADLFSQCPRQSGSTRFFDFATYRCGYVFGNNTNWGALPGGWNDRADQFGNDGNTSSNCLYRDINCRGTSVLLPRGFAVDWSNVVSSNRWTTASYCVTSC